VGGVWRSACPPHERAVILPALTRHDSGAPGCYDWRDHVLDGATRSLAQRETVSATRATAEPAARGSGRPGQWPGS
jgi:hypothetical protein